MIVLLDPWSGGSRLYRFAVIAGMALVFLGIVLAIIGATTQNSSLITTALVVLGTGIAAHSLSLLERVRVGLRRRAERQRGRK
ncbi:hypothetical protein [Micrococcoides hystricis]|uniref:DUF3188 domain-containing protein n=1 Tax=Micrococcoides hystricis TaxID=1572761 RepID=A0ABV6PB62_9MICC